MNTLKFSQNWASKLDNKKYFTTLRVIKENIYQIDQALIIELNKKQIGTAKIKTINTCYIDKLPELICIMDTGYNKTDTEIILKKIYPNQNWLLQKVAIILLEWIEKKE